MTVVVTHPEPPPAWRATEAVSALGTRMSFAAVAWLVLVEAPDLARLALVVGVQALAYLLACAAAPWLLGRVDPARVSFAADLVGAVAIVLVAVFATHPVAVAVLVGVVGATRAPSDLAKNLLAAAAAHTAVVDGRRPVPTREWLARPGLVVAGAGLGALAAWLGPAGALWLIGLAFAACAALVVLAAPERTAVSAPVVADDLADLRRSRLARRLAVVLLLTGFLGQAATVAVVPVWAHGVLGSAHTLGVVGGACVLSAVAGGVVLTALAVRPIRYLLLGLGFLAGGGAVAVLQGMAPVGLLVVVGAFLAGLATASVTPVLGGLLSHRIPAPLRGRVAAAAAIVTGVGVALGSFAGGWVVAHTSVRLAIGLAAVGYLLAVLTPVFGYRTWQALGAADAPVLAAAPRLSARLSVTLAYADGQWLVEVRKGRALLGSRHPVQPAQALSTLSMLEVPGLRTQVEQALATDQTEASRHVDRMRTELTELEAKLAGLKEMMDLSSEEPPSERD
jgi:hypothetical protein